MALLTTSEELAKIREAIQLITSDTTGQALSSFDLDGLEISYAPPQQMLSSLMKREKELLKRLTIRNVRKRTIPDFS